MVVPLMTSHIPHFDVSLNKLWISRSIYGLPTTTPGARIHQKRDISWKRIDVLETSTNVTIVLISDKAMFARSGIHVVCQKLPNLKPTEHAMSVTLET